MWIEIFSCISTGFLNLQHLSPCSPSSVKHQLVHTTCNSRHTLIELFLKMMHRKLTFPSTIGILLLKRQGENVTRRCSVHWPIYCISFIAEWGMLWLDSAGSNTVRRRYRIASLTRYRERKFTSCWRTLVSLDVKTFRTHNQSSNSLSIKMLM